ncbi:hypothetical protein ES319_A09G146700v1 [Gossypium barbadense]|uniref:Uncharacterized protein n=1 Tax=Gossypium barbadense TaxID=3634 RepID=A0A5J5UEP0_GOSBA|nr:hypothetical protein ES319_A09G146700v1 [Gossypium barbadense]
MHHLCPRSRRHPSLSRGFAACQALVRFFALHRIKPHAPPLTTYAILKSQFKNYNTFFNYVPMSFHL